MLFDLLLEKKQKSPELFGLPLKLMLLILLPIQQKFEQSLQKIAHFDLHLELIDLRPVHFD